MTSRTVQLIGGPNDGDVLTTTELEVRIPCFDLQFGVMSHAVYRVDRIVPGMAQGFIARFVDEVIVSDGAVLYP